MVVHHATTPPITAAKSVSGHLYSTVGIGSLAPRVFSKMHPSASNPPELSRAIDEKQRTLGCDLFIGKARNVCTLTGVLDRDAADIAALIEIQNGVLIQILRLSYFGCLELYIERVRVLKILNLHLSHCSIY